MRTTICMGLVMVCWLSAGCSTLNKKTNTASSGSRPFTGATDRTDSGDSTAPPAGANGFLAGQVVDRFNHRPTEVYIQVVDLQDASQSKSARLDVREVRDGYFMIQGLKAGRNYQLIARAKVGDKLVAGTTVAQPPNPRIAIYVSEDLVGPETPPIPSNPATPDKKGDPSAGKEGKATGSPGATLDAPTKSEPGPVDRSPEGPNPVGTESGTGGPIPVPDASKIADKNDPRANTSPSVEINGPGTSKPIPPPPGPTSRRDEPPAWSPVGGPKENSTAATSVPVPSCQLFGRKLENFALYGLDGQPWEFKRDRKGKVVLIDFWSTTCTPCLNALPELQKLHAKYSEHGLEVIGIAYEKGTVEEQEKKVRKIVRGWQDIRYTILLGGGSACPVQAQFRVNALPTLILIDEKGAYVLRKEGLDREGQYELEMEIRKRLGLPLR